MDVFVVNGGNPLSGRVHVSGAKNAALPIMASALLAHGTTTLHQVPDLVDVRTLSSLLTTLGCQVARQSDQRLELEVVDETHCVADYDLVRRMRASVCVMGPLLARRGVARVSLPGGCNIGHRPIDIHLRGFAALGADVQFENGDVLLEAQQLIGAEIDLDGPHGSSVTGTCNVISAAVLARGHSVLTNAACEPEVVALADFLNSMGAKISGQGTPTIEIEGVEHLEAVEATIIPDRIEAATFMIAAAISRGKLCIENVNPEHLQAVIEILSEINVDVEVNSENQIVVVGDHPHSPVNLTALPFPGVPTDVQAQLTALLSVVPGRSIIRDQVFPDRFMHCAELNRMHARIRQAGDRACVNGVAHLYGANVMASDLRASAALVLAALAAQGESVIHRIYHLDRGYEQLEKKLNAVGANIFRCSENNASDNQRSGEQTIRRSA